MLSIKRGYACLTACIYTGSCQCFDFCRMNDGWFFIIFLLQIFLFFVGCFFHCLNLLVYDLYSSQSGFEISPLNPLFLREDLGEFTKEKNLKTIFILVYKCHALLKCVAFEKNYFIRIILFVCLNAPAFIFAK